MLRWASRTLYNRKCVLHLGGLTFGRELDYFNIVPTTQFRWDQVLPALRLEHFRELMILIKPQPRWRFLKLLKQPLRALCYQRLNNPSAIRNFSIVFLDTDNMCDCHSEPTWTNHHKLSLIDYMCVLSPVLYIMGKAECCTIHLPSDMDGKGITRDLDSLSVYLEEHPNIKLVHKLL